MASVEIPEGLAPVPALGRAVAVSSAPAFEERFRVYATPTLCLLLYGAIIALAQAPETLAQPASALPLKMIVPVAAGGTSDVVARSLARALEKELGRPVVVENRAGASGRVAVAALKSATPDGGTVLFAPIAIPVVGPLVFRNKTYDPGADLAPVAQVSTYHFALAVASTHPARDLAAFLQWARERPGLANVGNPGEGSVPHLLAVRLAQVAGIEMTHVPHQALGSLVAALMGGDIAAGIGAVSDFLALHRGGRLRVLATSAGARSPVLPEVPTFQESGYAGITASGWHAVYAPKSTPSETIESLSKALVAAVKSSGFRDALVPFGLAATGTTPQDLSAIVEADTAFWRRIIESSGLSVE